MEAVSLIWRQCPLYGVIEAVSLIWSNIEALSQLA